MSDNNLYLNKEKLKNVDVFNWKQIDAQSEMEGAEQRNKDIQNRLGEKNAQVELNEYEKAMKEHFDITAELLSSKYKKKDGAEMQEVKNSLRSITNRLSEEVKPGMVAYYKQVDSVVNDYTGLIDACDKYLATHNGFRWSKTGRYRQRLVKKLKEVAEKEREAFLKIYEHNELYQSRSEGVLLGNLLGHRAMPVTQDAEDFVRDETKTSAAAFRLADFMGFAPMVEKTSRLQKNNAEGQREFGYRIDEKYDPKIQGTFEEIKKKRSSKPNFISYSPKGLMDLTAIRILSFLMGGDKIDYEKDIIFTYEETQIERYKREFKITGAKLKTRSDLFSDKVNAQSLKNGLGNIPPLEGGLPFPLLDADLVTAINSMEPEMVTFMLGDILTQSQMDAFIDRLNYLKDILKKEAKDNNLDGRLVKSEGIADLQLDDKVKESIRKNKESLPVISEVEQELHDDYVDELSKYERITKKIQKQQVEIDNRKQDFEPLFNGAKEIFTAGTDIDSMDADVIRKQLGIDEYLEKYELNFDRVFAKEEEKKEKIYLHIPNNLRQLAKLVITIRDIVKNIQFHNICLKKDINEEGCGRFTEKFHKEYKAQAEKAEEYAAFCDEKVFEDYLKRIYELSEQKYQEKLRKKREEEKEKERKAKMLVDSPAIVEKKAEELLKAVDEEEYKVHEGRIENARKGMTFVESVGSSRVKLKELKKQRKAVIEKLKNGEIFDKYQKEIAERKKYQERLNSAIQKRNKERGEILDYLYDLFYMELTRHSKDLKKWENEVDKPDEKVFSKSNINSVKFELLTEMKLNTGWHILTEEEDKKIDELLEGLNLSQLSKEDFVVLEKENPYAARRLLLKEKIKNAQEQGVEKVPESYDVDLEDGKLTDLKVNKENGTIEVTRLKFKDKGDGETDKNSFEDEKESITIFTGGKSIHAFGGVQSQGEHNYLGFYGICGPASGAHIINQIYGMKITDENKMVDMGYKLGAFKKTYHTERNKDKGYAPQKDNKGIYKTGNVLKSSDIGGAYSYEMANLYKCYDLETKDLDKKDISIDRIVKEIKAGNGVQLTVNSDLLWYDGTNAEYKNDKDTLDDLSPEAQDKVKNLGKMDSDHWISVCGVYYEKGEENKEEAKPKGFLIMDTGFGVTRLMSAEKLQSILLGDKDLTMVNPSMVVIGKKTQSKEIKQQSIRESKERKKENASKGKLSTGNDNLSDNRIMREKIAKGYGNIYDSSLSMLYINKLDNVADSKRVSHSVFNANETLKLDTEQMTRMRTVLNRSTASIKDEKDMKLWCHEAEGIFLSVLDVDMSVFEHMSTKEFDAKKFKKGNQILNMVTAPGFEDFVSDYEKQLEDKGEGLLLDKSVIAELKVRISCIKALKEYYNFHSEFFSIGTSKLNSKFKEDNTQMNLDFDEIMLLTNEQLKSKIAEYEKRESDSKEENKKKEHYKVYKETLTKALEAREKSKTILWNKENDLTDYYKKLQKNRGIGEGDKTDSESLKNKWKQQDASFAEDFKTSGIFKADLEREEKEKADIFGDKKKERKSFFGRFSKGKAAAREILLREEKKEETSRQKEAMKIDIFESLYFNEKNYPKSRKGEPLFNEDGTISVSHISCRSYYNELSSILISTAIKNPDYIKSMIRELDEDRVSVRMYDVTGDPLEFIFSKSVEKDDDSPLWYSLLMKAGAYTARINSDKEKYMNEKPTYHQKEMIKVFGKSGDTFNCRKKDMPTWHGLFHLRQDTTGDEAIGFISEMLNANKTLIGRTLPDNSLDRLKEREEYKKVRENLSDVEKEKFDNDFEKYSQFYSPVEQGVQYYDEEGDYIAVDADHDYAITDCNLEERIITIANSDNGLTSEIPFNHFTKVFSMIYTN